LSEQDVFEYWGARGTDLALNPALPIAHTAAVLYQVFRSTSWEIHLRPRRPWRFRHRRAELRVSLDPWDQ
jgi:hypothetical protein